MKNFVKIFFIFFAFFLLLFATGQSTPACDIQPINYIQNDYQKVVLISNSFNGGEIFAGKIQKTPNLSQNNNNFISNIDFQNNIFSNNITRNQRVTINIVSALFSNDISIRAP